MRPQIEKLQKKMDELGIDVYVISDSDEHLSEYVSPHFHALEEYSGFMGGDGKMTVTLKEAALWTDGRYFTQAEDELTGSGIELMRMGEPGVPAMEDWILQMLPAGGILGFDGTCTSHAEGERFRALAAKRNGGTLSSWDLCGELWANRPAERVSDCWILEECYTGKSAADKLNDLRLTMDRLGADLHVIATVDDIAWLLNLRADDIPNNPVFMAYLAVRGLNYNSITDENITDEKITDEKITDGNITDEKIPDQNIADQSITDQDVMPHKIAGRVIEGQNPNFAGLNPDFAGQSPNFAGLNPDFEGQNPDFAGQSLKGEGQRMPQAVLYTDPGHFAGDTGKNVLEYLASLFVELRPYHQIFEDLGRLGAETTDADALQKAGAQKYVFSSDKINEDNLHTGKLPTDEHHEENSKTPVILMDLKRCNDALVQAVPESCRILDQMNPTMKAKCRKNETEMENIRMAQRKDGLALTRFMHWFKTEGLRRVRAYEASEELGSRLIRENAERPECKARGDAGGSQDPYHSGGTEKISNGRCVENAETMEMESLHPLTEWECVERLHAFRAEGEHFLDESFGTISAYGPNAAMAHYAPSPDPEKDAVIRGHGLYLVDSGGQYLEGTTDVTRTWSCGPISEEERTGVTLAVIANLRLADLVFPEGTSGLTIDGIAREVFWKHGYNYNHGTGHGVGHVLNVHEAPVGIRYKAATIEAAWPMEEGMYVSDEPGHYVPGAFGVRIENLLLVRPAFTNAFGSFLRFETVTWCPIDKSCLDLSLMEDRDIRLLNLYHAEVYEKLAPLMDGEELSWLQMMCEPEPSKRTVSRDRTQGVGCEQKMKNQ